MISIGDLDRLLGRTIQKVDQSREEFYKMGENLRQEYEKAKKELTEIKSEITYVIHRVDTLEKEYTQARRHLMEVSQEFNRYGEGEIKQAYEDAHKKQIELLTLREREKLLRLRRDALELNLKTLQSTLLHSEKMLSNVSMALKFLNNDLETVSSQIGIAHQIQALGSYIIMAQEEERKRVAREIHDGPAQSFANVVMRAEFCIKLLDKEPTKVRDELYRLIDLVQKNLQDVRKIIFDLRPMVLDDLGLVPAIKRYTEEYLKEYGIYTDTTVAGSERRLDSSLEVALFRVIQESLTNVKKHSDAKRVMVKIEFLPNRVNVIVKDDGCGFDKEKTMLQKQGSGFGLIGMRERIQLLKGKFEIKTAPSKGTEVFISLPTATETQSAATETQLLHNIV